MFCCGLAMPSHHGTSQYHYMLKEAVLSSSYVLHPTHLLVSKLKEMIAVAG